MMKQATKCGVYDEKILRLFRLGFSEDEIAEVIEEEETFVERRRKVLIVAGKITESEIGNVRQNKEKRIAKMKVKVAAMSSFRRDLDTEVVQDYIEYSKAQFHLGKLEYLEVKALSQVLLMDASFITLGNVNLVTTYYTRERKSPQALEFMERCDEILEPGDSRKAVLSMVKGVIEENMRKREEKSQVSKREKASATGRSKVINIRRGTEPSHRRASGWEH